MLERKISSTTKRKIKVKCYKIGRFTPFAFFAIHTYLNYTYADYWTVAILLFFILFILVCSILSYFKNPRQKRIIREMVDSAGMIGFAFYWARWGYFFYMQGDYRTMGLFIFLVLVFLAGVIVKYFYKNKKKP